MVTIFTFINNNIKQKIFAIQNGVITAKYTIGSFRIDTLTMDSTGYVVIACILINSTYYDVSLYNSIFSHTNKKTATNNNRRLIYAGGDTEGRLALATSTYIHIYN